MTHLLSLSERWCADRATLSARQVCHWSWGERVVAVRAMIMGAGVEVTERMGLLPMLERHRARISSVTAVDERGRRRSELGAATTRPWRVAWSASCEATWQVCCATR